MDKDKIGVNFAKNYNSYSSEAKVQEVMAEYLVNHLSRYCGNNYDKIFEIGCGTGFVSKQVCSKINYKSIICNDITSEYSKEINHIYKSANSFKFLKGDAEILLNKIGVQDLIISGATFQWFDDVEQTLKGLSDKISNNGVLAFSTFGEKNFKEIKAVTGLGLNYKPKEELEDILKNNFEIIFSSETIQTLHFASSLKVLKHMKNTGVNSLLGKNDKFVFSEFEKRYSEKFLDSRGLSLTYHPMYFIVKPLAK